jgi:3-methyladenine DNA glycosylase/8-oxoguanine DNA glycosylase
METAKKRIVESTKQIWRLYYKRVNVEEAVKSMRGQNISAELVKSIYNQLSADAENLMEDRFYHYTIECSNYHQINYWTSRYLLIYKSEEYQSASHEINIFDLFNNTSM